MLDVLELKPGGVGSVHGSLHLCLSVHDFMFAPKASRKNVNGPNAHVSATLSGLIHANVSGVVGSGSSFTTMVLFLPSPAAYFGTWIKYTCVILTFSLLR